MDASLAPSLAMNRNVVPPAYFGGAGRHGKASLQPGGKTPGPGVRNVDNRLRALPGACVRSPAADPRLESGVDGPPAGIPLVDLLGLLAGDPGQVPHGPAYVDQVLLPAPFDQGVQVAAPGGVLVDHGHPLARQQLADDAVGHLLGPGLVLRRHFLACHGPYRKGAWGVRPWKKAGRDGGAPAPRSGDLDQVDHRMLAKIRLDSFGRV